MTQDDKSSVVVAGPEEIDPVVAHEVYDAVAYSAPSPDPAAE
jgi:hypothetical protein